MPNNESDELSENCIEVSNIIADCICSDEDQRDYNHAAYISNEILGLNKTSFLKNLKEITDEIQEAAVIFELDMGDPKLLKLYCGTSKRAIAFAQHGDIKNSRRVTPSCRIFGVESQKIRIFCKNGCTNRYI